MVILSNFAESLLELITEHNLTPAQFSQQMDCGKGTISRYLNAKKLPTVEMLIRMADFFDCSIDYLLGREMERYPDTFYPCPTFQERFPALLKALNVTKYRFQKETGIAESAIYSWQSGKHKPKTENILIIAKTYHCSVDFILGRSKNL